MKRVYIQYDTPLSCADLFIDIQNCTEAVRIEPIHAFFLKGEITSVL